MLQNVPGFLAAVFIPQMLLGWHTHGFLSASVFAAKSLVLLFLAEALENAALGHNVVCKLQKI